MKVRHMKIHYGWYTLVGQHVVLCEQEGAMRFTSFIKEVTCKRCQHMHALAGER